jgi:hypothetical protein
MSIIRTTALAFLLATPLLGGCQSLDQQASARVGGLAEPNGRTWALLGSPRPDTPPDRDARKD